VIDEQINFEPHFQQETLPCEGEVGDFVVLSPLTATDRDASPQGLASLWFCIRRGNTEQPATWARVQFDGIATCRAAVPRPPQNHPTLKAG
jgi:hypothetical protein